jgi:hypothetical protein
MNTQQKSFPVQFQRAFPSSTYMRTLNTVFEMVRIMQRTGSGCSTLVTDTASLSNAHINIFQQF